MNRYQPLLPRLLAPAVLGCVLAAVTGCDGERSAMPPADTGPTGTDPTDAGPTEPDPGPSETPDALRTAFTAAAVGEYRTGIVEARGPDGTLMGFTDTRVILTRHGQLLEVRAYLDPAGEQPLFHYASSGPYEIVGRAAAIAGAFEIDLRNDASLLTLQRDEPALLDALGLGDCPLELGRAVDIRGGCGAPLFSVTDCVDQDLVRVDGEGLRFGAPGVDRCVERPSELGPPIAPATRGSFDPERPIGYLLTLEALVRDDVAALPGILAHFTPEAQRRNDPAVDGLLGRTHFMALSQFDRLAALGVPPAQAQVHAMEQIRLMSRAVSQPGYDPKYDSWLGGAFVIAGFETEDDALVSQGYEWLERGVESYPEFNRFTNGLIAYGMPTDAPGFAEAPEQFLSILEDCTHGQLDRSNPDYTPFDTPEFRATQATACYNSERVPHGVQGFMLWAGDAVLRSGDAGVARVLYQNARALDGWESWPFQALIEERLDDDLIARAALLRDDDPSNDPAIVPANGTCAYCHAN